MAHQERAFKRLAKSIEEPQLLSKEFIGNMKIWYPQGTKIIVDQMGDDPNPIPKGTKGEVLSVDDMGTVHCRFENGRQLGLIPGEDIFHILNEY